MFTLRHRLEYETEWMFEFIKNLSFGQPRVCQCIRPCQCSKPLKDRLTLGNGLY